MSQEQYNFLDELGLGRVIDYIKTKFASLSHSHKLSEITDYTVDSSMSSTSMNPVQNKVIKFALDEKVPITRTVNGKTQTYYTTETYWTWDRVGSEEIKCNEIEFCGIKFPSNKIETPSTSHIDTIKTSSHVRYKYYGTSTEHVGTIFTELKDKTITDNSVFYEDKTVEETRESVHTEFLPVIFWVFWICIIVAIVIGFYYLENRMKNRQSS